MRYATSPGGDPMGDKEPRPLAQASPVAAPAAAPVFEEVEVADYGNAEAAAALARQNDLNSMRPGTASANAPLPDMSKLTRAGYQVEPIASMDVLYSSAKQGP